MLRVFGFHPLAELYILAGTVAGKREEILVEVRLIVELGLMRNTRQIDGPGKVDRPKDMGKAVEARDFLWRDPDESLELRTQVVLADPDLITQFSNGFGAMLLIDFRNGMFHRIHSMGRFPEPDQQELLQQSESCLNCGGSMEAFTDFRSIRSPKRIQWHDLTVQFRERHLQERIGSPGLKWTP
jgi:hypothetical protein